MTWCPLLCYPLSPSPVNIERFFKLGAKFCRKFFSSQALNCFLLLVHTASSFATGQKELMFQRESPNVWGWQSWWSQHWSASFNFFNWLFGSLFWLLGVSFFSHWKVCDLKVLKAISFLKIEHFTYINVPKIYIILHCFWKCLCYIHARKTRKETIQCHISDLCLRIGLT